MRQSGCASGGLSERGFTLGASLGEQSGVGESDTHQHKGDRELVGDEFEVVTDLHPVGGPPPQEVQVIDDEQAHLTGQKRVQGAAREIGSVAPRRAGVSEEVQQ